MYDGMMYANLGHRNQVPSFTTLLCIRYPELHLPTETLHLLSNIYLPSSQQPRPLEITIVPSVRGYFHSA